jgi:hypothetical protein
MSAEHGTVLCVIVDQMLQLDPVDDGAPADPICAP